MTKGAHGEVVCIAPSREKMHLIKLGINRGWSGGRDQLCVCIGANGQFGGGVGWAKEGTHCGTNLGVISGNFTPRGIKGRVIKGAPGESSLRKPITAWGQPS